VAFVGAALGLLLMGLLVFSVLRVSDDSSRPAAPVIHGPMSSTDAPTPVVAAPPPEPLPPAAPLPPESPVPSPEPSALFNESTVTAQTMVAPPPPRPEIAPEDSLRSRLHEYFPLLFP
jgi:hypothetical protein